MLSEDLSVFLQDFGVPVQAKNKSGLGLLDMPTEVIADGTVLSTDYALTCLTSAFGHLKYKDVLTVAGSEYTVREVVLIDDGKFCTIFLTLP